MQTFDDQSSQYWCLFKSDAQPFAVALEAVAEVVETERLVRIALCPPQVLGLCSIRREVVPVLRLTEPAEPEVRDSESRVVVLILRSDQGAWGIRIDREGTVVTEGVAEPFWSANPPAAGAAFAGSLRRGEVGHAILDPGPTWQNVRATVEDWYHGKLWGGAYS